MKGTSTQLSFYNMKLLYVDNESFEFQQLQGRVVLVDFFTTSCLPCMAAVPTLLSLHKKYDGKGLAVIGIAMEQQPTKLLPVYTSSQNIDYPVLVANETVYKGETIFKRVLSIPRHYLIDRCGKIRGMYQRVKTFDKLKAQIKELLKESKKCN